MLIESLFLAFQVALGGFQLHRSFLQFALQGGQRTLLLCQFGHFCIQSRAGLVLLLGPGLTLSIEFVADALAFGVTGFVLWMVNFGVGFFFLQLVDWFSISTTFFIFFVLGCCAFTFVKLYLPETKGRTLESLETEFTEKYGDDESTGKPRSYLQT